MFVRERNGHAPIMLLKGGVVLPKVGEEEVWKLFEQGFGYLTKDGKKRILDADALLVLAGKHGLRGVKTELLHYGIEEKTVRAVVRATVEFDGECYQALCELTDRDVQHPKYFLRACETRAVARALRFAFALPLAFEVEKESVKAVSKKEVSGKDIEEAEREEESLATEAEETLEDLEYLEW